MLEVFKEVINADSHIKFAYLFGSKATGKSGPLSDFDLAVFLDGRLNMLRYRLRLIEELARMAKNENFDLITLNDASPVLKYEVIRSGKPIKEDKQRRVAFETGVLREYLDTDYLRRIQQQYLKKNCVEGRTVLVNRNIIAVRLERLNGYLATLHKVKDYEISRFKDDPFIHGTAERYLHLAIECMLDIGNHIISDRDYPKPATYGEIFKILADKGVISEKLFCSLEGMAAFRNVLVHDYLKLEQEKVYKILREKLPHLKKLAAVFAELL